MSDILELERIFPLESEIPVEHRLSGPVHQRCMLIDGMLKPWDGPYQTVLSPIWACTRDGNAEANRDWPSSPGLCRRE